MDVISREDAINALWKALCEYEDKTEKQFQESDELDVGDWIVHRIFVQNMSDIDRQTILNLPSAQRWIPVTERLPEERDWYLGIFKEPDTGWINPLPFICDYLLGKKTKATTKEGWILKECTDREEHIDYYFNLECVAWMPLPKSSYDCKDAAWSALGKLPSAQPERLTDDDFETIRIHLNAYKEKLCNQQRWKEAEEYQRIIDRFMAFASAQPERTCEYWDNESKFCALCRPSAQSTIEPRKGKWIEHKDYPGLAYLCSECGYFTTMRTNFCPNCGADMREGGQDAVGDK